MEFFVYTGTRSGIEAFEKETKHLISISQTFSPVKNLPHTTNKKKFDSTFRNSLIGLIPYFSSLGRGWLAPSLNTPMSQKKVYHTHSY